jgi:hypothetical protein
MMRREYSLESDAAAVGIGFLSPFAPDASPAPLWAHWHAAISGPWDTSDSVFLVTPPNLGSVSATTAG